MLSLNQNRISERLTSPRALEINNSGYSRRTDTAGNVAEGELEQINMIGLLPSQANTVIESKNIDASFASPLLQRSVLLPQSNTRSTIGGNSFLGQLIADKKKFTNRQELESYYLKKEGKSKLETFLVPDLDDIKKVLSEKNIQHQR